MITDEKNKRCAEIARQLTEIASSVDRLPCQADVEIVLKAVNLLIEISSVRGKQ
jgi:hypothetical protein